MKPRHYMLSTLVCLGFSASAVAEAKPATVFSFDADKPGEPPKGFAFGLTGKGTEGKWMVVDAKDAPSGGRVLAQTDTDDTDNRFPVAYAGPELKDLRLSVKCKAISGKVDQACGLVFRLKDADNYYVVRANALEDNIRLYSVKDGKRRQLANWSGTVTVGAWHAYEVEVRGDRIQVSWDGMKILDHRDSTFMEAGRVGVWTKADSVTYFDDLAVAPIAGGTP